MLGGLLKRINDQRALRRPSSTAVRSDAVTLVGFQRFAALWGKKTADMTAGLDFTNWTLKSKISELLKESCKKHCWILPEPVSGKQ